MSFYLPFTVPLKLLVVREFADTLYKPIIQPRDDIHDLTQTRLHKKPTISYTREKVRYQLINNHNS